MTESGERVWSCLKDTFFVQRMYSIVRDLLKVTLPGNDATIPNFLPPVPVFLFTSINVSK